MTVEYSGFSITWNETLIGDTVDAPCTGTGLNGKANTALQKSLIIHGTIIKFSKV